MKKYYGYLRSTSKVILISLSIFLSGCDNLSNEPKTEYEYFFSFEQGWEGWEARAMDLELGDGEIEWDIYPSTHFSWDGNWAMKYYLNNLNDAGKIWIEQAFEVEPTRTYRVTLAYEFGTADFGIINLFRIIAGVLPQSPEEVDDLLPTYQGETGNGYDEYVGFRWVNREYSFTVKSDANGKLYILIGVWGTWETHRTYYVDSVRIHIKEN